MLNPWKSRKAGRPRLSRGGLWLLPVLLGPVGMSVTVHAEPSAVKKSEPVTVDLKVFKVNKDSDGKESLGSAEKAKPGEILEYRATYTNVSKGEVKNLQATLPIPKSTEVMPASLSPKIALASQDGRSFAAMPLMQTVKSADGKTQSRPLPLAEYRALRWPVGTLTPGEAVTVSARVRLSGGMQAG